MNMLSRKLYPLWLTIIFFAFIIISCKKPVDDGNGSGGGNGSGNIEKHGVIYYDYYSMNAHPIFATKTESYRVCFDMNKNELRWKKKNEFTIPFYYPTISPSPLSPSYSNAFLQSNSIIRILPSTDSIGTEPISGIYFQKIDITTGEALISKRIIEPTDFNVNQPFCISEVTTDGQNFYFSCNNGFVYCFNSSGNLVWKKGGFTFGLLITNRYGFIYYNDNQIFIHTFNPFSLVCLNANTGDLLWTTPGLQNGLSREVVFSKNHLVLFESPFYGRTFVIKKLDGQKVIENLSTYTSSAYTIHPYGAINDSTVIYSDRNGGISQIDVTKPGILKTTTITDPIDLINSILYKGKLYSVKITTDNKITALKIDPITDNIQKNEMVIPFSQNIQFFKHRYYITNDKLYILSTGRLENNLWTTTVPVMNNIPLSVSVFDVNSVNPLKQFYNLPGGIIEYSSPTIYSTNYHFLYNLIVTE